MMTRAKPPRAFSKHLICERLSNERRQKLVDNNPLIVPPQLPGRFFEHAIVRCSGAPRFIDERVVSLEHGEMQLGHEYVRIVARVGAPRKITDRQIEEVVTKTLESMPSNSTHWSTRLMAQEMGLSQNAIVRIWRAFGLQPHRVENFKFSKDRNLWRRCGTSWAYI
jgi:hypothetical protein